MNNFKSKYNTSNMTIRPRERETATGSTGFYKRLGHFRYVHHVIKWISIIMSKFPTRKKIIVFESFHGLQISDNPRALFEYMKNNLPDYKLYWSVDRKRVHRFKNRDIHLLRRYSLKWMFHLARAQYWITNNRLPLWLPKPKGTTYIQTWHGTPLKRLASDMDVVSMPGMATETYKANFVQEAKRWDYLLSANGYASEIFTGAFQYSGKVIETGYPRNDILVNLNNKATINRLKVLGNLPLDKKIILYAPTWRDNQFHATGKYAFNLTPDFDLLQERLGDDFIILTRMHYLVGERINVGRYKNFVYDFSDYEDISKLLLMADVLITDYSSCLFDYAILKRPMVFYVTDLDEYRDKLRGFYFDFENEAPGKLVKTTAQLIEELVRIKANNFKVDPDFESFFRRFCYLEDGQASERVVKTIIDRGLGNGGKWL